MSFLYCSAISPVLQHALFTTLNPLSISSSSMLSRVEPLQQDGEDAGKH